MSASKIKYYEAGTIAARIAGKAFEHTLAPMEVEMQAHLKACYERILGFGISANIRELIGCGVLCENEDIPLTFPMSEGSNDYRTEKYHIKDGFLGVRPGSSFQGFKVENEKDCAEYWRLYDLRKPIYRAQSALAEELRQQMDGKSAKHVMKTWPEAARFVADYFNIGVDTGKDVSMTIPLEGLLSKYLTPLLAAPQGV